MYWSAGSQTLGCTKQLFCQLVVIWNVDAGFNNCHMSDMTDHLTMSQYHCHDQFSVVILVFLLMLFLRIYYTDYMKFEEQEMRIIGTF